MAFRLASAPNRIRCEFWTQTLIALGIGVTVVDYTDVDGFRLLTLCRRVDGARAVVIVPSRSFDRPALATIANAWQNQLP